ncbi:MULTISPECIES: hypothetical protein [unclassified Chelatococcus]|uniref:hypothetical protein n=1 Tax=unclassified Chelatococcus TaxID=2638111 RepID=UPI001BD147C1|nr:MULTISPECIES: hypothetical protein [unclassified Chelatococcus]MBS7698746.1 hypothetical protein [Chelatococcus sp. YT9]MBX3543605.1 hypothetical protein [Chelatococcus sp.]MBX3554672.1 hypothetical protein [Chelatococcus sp.]
MTSPWLQTGSGIAFDLLNPTPDMVDLRRDVPDALGRIARFTGHTPTGPYSVAQHSCIGADAVLAETGRRDIAAAFLLHDAHEAYLGDISSPMAEALAEAARIVTAGHFGGSAVLMAIKRLKLRADAAIYAAAGVPWPLAPEVVAAVHLMDIRMLATERRQLLTTPPRPWNPIVEQAEPVRLNRGAIVVWPWARAADEWRDRLNRLCPAALAA